MITLNKLYFWRKLAKKKRKQEFRKELPGLTLEQRFSRIYKINYWNNEESRSGQGSTLNLTENLRAELPKLFAQFNICKVFDGPCGDFNWMKLVVRDTEIIYIGADIVHELIEENIVRHTSPRVSFIKLDLRIDPLPNADLMICRDCLFHLSYRDTRMLLENFIKADIPYLLTTTYQNEATFKNTDIESGHFRKIDLLQEPYFFPANTIAEIKDYLPGEHPRFLCLWSRQQITQALKLMRLAQQETMLADTEVENF